MVPKNKKKYFIIIPVILIVILMILVILYFTTDLLKSNKTLFIKYLSQNADAFKVVIDNKTEKELSNLLKQNKYESKGELTATYTENINTSLENKNNDINKIKIDINSQSDYLNNYLYKDIILTHNDKTIIKTEYIHDGEKYGIRFPIKFSQFLAIKNNDLKQVASNIGLSEQQVAHVPDTIEEYNLNQVINFSDEELENIKNRYLKLLNENISNDNYSKQKEAMITIGENSLITTAYSITLNQEQANAIYIKILEQLKTDETILNKISNMEQISYVINTVRNDENNLEDKHLQKQFVRKIEQRINEIQANNIGTSEVKLTVYQINGKTVRTQLTEETRQLTIDLNTGENNIDVNIQNKNNNQEKDIITTTTITKNNKNEEKIFSIKTENIIGDEISTFELYRNKKMNDSKADISTGVSYNDGKNNLLILDLSEQIDLNTELANSIKLNEANSATINDYKPEIVNGWINEVINYLKQVKTNNEQIITNILKIETMKKAFNISQNPIITENPETTEIEKNKFNAKFEFYSGKEKKTEEIIQMIEEAKTNLKSAKVSYSNEGNSEATKKLQQLIIEVEKDANKTGLSDSIKEMLEKSKTYTVEIVKNENDLVTSIIITTNK